MNTFPKSISIKEFLRAVRSLPEDEPVHDPKKWYRTQKEHWIGWLREYKGPGFYGRITNKKRDARYVYNHIVEPKMLLWLIDAAGVDSKLIESARAESSGKKTMMAQSGAIRRHVPWDLVAFKLWPQE